MSWRHRGAVAEAVKRLHGAGHCRESVSGPGRTADRDGRGIGCGSC